jgi:lipopolysaccharide export LptBFGC system permease protein LptF
MRISDRYIGAQVLLGTIYAIVILSLVLVLGNLFKEIRPLLVDHGAPPTLMLRFVLSVLPVSLMYTLPWGFLSAVLLVFGRLSSNQEITAFRVSGMSLFRIAMPVFVIGAALSGVSVWLNVNVVPLAKGSLKQLVYEQATRDPDSLLKPGVVQGDLGTDSRVKALIEGKEGDWVTGLHLFLLSDAAADARTGTYVYASRAALAVLKDSNQLRMKLEGAYFEAKKSDGNIEMAFTDGAEPLLIDLKAPRVKGNRPKEMTNLEILDAIQTRSDLTDRLRVSYRSEITKRHAFSMACFAFAFIAVPLGLKARRRDSSSGLMMSLLLGGAYFMFTVIADSFETNLGASLVLWSPNAICILLGLFLFRRARFK